MKKLLSILALLLCAANITMAAKEKIYVNPIRNTVNIDARIAGRLYKKGVLGLTKAKTIEVVTGDAIHPNTPAAELYDGILTMTITKVDVSEAPLSKLLSLSTEKDHKPVYIGCINVDVSIVDAKTGESIFEVKLSPSARDEDKTMSIFLATNDFDYEMLDMTDDAFRIRGEVIEATQIDVDKKDSDKVKKVRVQVGSNLGARKDQMFMLYKIAGNNSKLIGSARCEQVLNSEESILVIRFLDKGQKNTAEAILNNDGSYKIEAISCSDNSLAHIFAVDKMSFKKDRPDYLNPENRVRKPVVAFLGVSSNDNSLSSEQVKLLQSVTIEAINDVTTVDMKKVIYPSVQAAKEDGIDGLIDITVDFVIRSHETVTDKKGKTSTIYKSKLYYSIMGVDVQNNRSIEMQSKFTLGSNSTSKKGDDNAIESMESDIQKFCEDIFPICANISDVVKTKKNAVKEVHINVGTALGVKKNMKFDIYEQRKEGGEDSRFLLGEGTVKGDGLTENEAIVSISGKKNSEQLFELFQETSDVDIILISKASHSVVGNVLDGLLKNK